MSFEESAPVVVGVWWPVEYHGERGYGSTAPLGLTRSMHTVRLHFGPDYALHLNCRIFQH